MREMVAADARYLQNHMYGVYDYLERQKNGNDLTAGGLATVSVYQVSQRSSNKGYQYARTGRPATPISIKQSRVAPFPPTEVIQPRDVMKAIDYIA